VHLFYFLNAAISLNADVHVDKFQLLDFLSLHQYFLIKNQHFLDMILFPHCKGFVNSIFKEIQKSFDSLTHFFQFLSFLRLHIFCSYNFVNCLLNFIKSVALLSEFLFKLRAIIIGIHLVFCNQPLKFIYFQNQ
jgi:hypothetical protein